MRSYPDARRQQNQDGLYHLCGTGALSATRVLRHGRKRTAVLPLPQSRRAIWHHRKRSAEEQSCFRKMGEVTNKTPGVLVKGSCSPSALPGTMDIAMSDDTPRGMPLTGPFFYGTFDQRRAITRWEDASWTFLHWTEVPGIMGVLEGPLDEIIFIDENGWAWKGPLFSRSNPVPLDKCPSVSPSESFVT